MKLNIAICGKTAEDITTLENLLTDYRKARALDLEIFFFTGSADLISSYTDSAAFDIVFFFADDSGISTIDIANLVRSAYSRHMFIIFISSKFEYIKKGFSVHPFSYLLKPYNEADLYSTLDRILTEICNSNVRFSIKATDDRLINININSLLYIETVTGKRSVIKFHLQENKVTAAGQLKDWKSKLEKYQFFSCYRGILVNLLHIQSFDKHGILLDNGETLPLSRASEQQLSSNYYNITVPKQPGA